MREIKVLSRNGHDVGAKWGGDAASRAAAQKVFDSLKAKGFTMFAAPADGGEATPKLGKFDPEAESIIAVPQLRGG